MERSCVRGVVLVVLVAAALPVATGSVAAEPVTVTIEVVDRDGTPVGGVELSVSWNESAEPKPVTTRSNGKVFVDVPEGADLEVRVTDDEYLRNRPAVFFDVQSGEELTVEASLPGTASVSVIDANGPVEGAEVRLSGHGITRTVETGENGIATIGPVERGNYGLRVSEPGYLSESMSITVTGTTNRTVLVEQADRLLTVRVVDDHFEPPRPVAEATVDIENVGTLTTGSNGQLGATVAVNRDYRISVTKDGYGSVTRTVAVDESDRSVTIAIQREESVSVDATSDRVVVGESTQLTVTGEYGEPVAGATVRVDGERVGQTNDQGVYVLSVDSPGNRTVTVAKGGVSASLTVEGVQPAGQGTETETTTVPPTATTQRPPPTATPTQEETPGGGSPGFGAAGIATALVALVAVLVARARDT